jgi:ubiquinone/menaquinone biosynthesis C-methylase UbiE
LKTHSLQLHINGADARYTTIGAPIFCAEGLHEHEMATAEEENGLSNAVELNHEAGDSPTFQDYAGYEPSPGSVLNKSKLSTIASWSMLIALTDSTKSLKESGLQDIVENGRRYCNESYFMPNGENEQTRLSVLHQIYLHILGHQLNKATLSFDITRVLDVGTGSGDWAISMAKRYPSEEIIATDISAFQIGDVPSNVKFEIDDVEQEWTFPQNSFDFIHLRYMSGLISNWKSVYREAFKCLIPSGQIEISDFGNFDTPPNSYHTIFSSAIRSASEAAGISLGLKHLERKIFDSLGYKNIRTVITRVPLGTWPRDAARKTVGKMMLISTLEGLEARSLRLLTKHLDWSADAVRNLCAPVKEEILADQSPNMFIPLHIVIAQKPL